MVVDVESRAVSVTEGKMAARACDACTSRSRASWYCPADDAFLCQSCDASIHSANHLAKRHKRIRLQSSPTSPEPKKTTKTADKTTSVWYEGFRRKTRTPRNKGLSFEKSLQITSNGTLVPELGGEEEDDEFYSLSSTDENKESLNCCVPIFYPFSSSDMVIDDDINSFGLVPDGVKTTNGEELEELERAVIDDDEGLFGFLPLDMNFGELTMDVESLLEEEQSSSGFKEPNSIGLVKEENNLGFADCKDLKNVKDEEEEEAMCENEGPRQSDREAPKGGERKTRLSLRLNYEAVISAWDNHGSPWKAGIKPEFNNFECCWECLLGGSTCPSHMMSGLEELSWTVESMTHRQERVGGRSNGKREARVMRYKEKRRTRLFAKKIRYEVRKLNAEQRPRIKGRFVKRT